MSQNSQENTCVRDSILTQAYDYKKETLAQVSSFEFSEISKNTFFTEHPWMPASTFSFSEAATRGVLLKKVFVKISQNLQENTCGLQNFQEHFSYRTPLELQLY